MRTIAALVAIVAAFAGSIAAFAAVQAVGPENRTGEFGYGDAATVPASGGTLLESRNFAAVLTALRRELGGQGALQLLDVTPTEASAVARAGTRMRYVEIDASGRSRSRIGDDPAPLSALVPVARIDPQAIDRLIRAARDETSAAVEHLSLSGGTREWSVDLDGGTPDRLVANLDGRGLRLPGEPNPRPPGAEPDSLLRAVNLTRVLAAARKQGATRVTSLDVRPDRVMFELDKDGRTLALSYGYDAQLTGRDVRPGGAAKSVALEALDPEAVERMARSARRAVDSKGLADVQYVLLDAAGVLKSRPELLLYLPSGHDPGYVVADLHGRGLTWPGRD